MRIAAIALLAIAISSCDRANSGKVENIAAPVTTQAVSPDEACLHIIEGLAGYRGDAGWSIVTRNELLASDAELWAEYREPDLCPGVAESDLDGDGASEFAITEVRREGDKLAQRLMLYRPNRGTTNRIWQAEDVPFAYVVFRTDEREARDFYSDEVTAIPHGSFAFERMEAWVVIYFETGGELRNVLVSD